MKKKSEPIVFFGSGPVAAKSLELLHQDFDVEAVITKPKPVKHRGYFPVPALAEKSGLQTYYASSQQELSDLFKGQPFKSRVGVVIDHGIIIPKDIIDYFPLGIVNSHFSLLPKWRGADPITFAILNGDERTGVSLMLIVEKLDEGPLLAQSDLELPSRITTPELTDTLIELSHAALVEILPKYMAGQVQPYPQDIEAPATYSRKLTKQDGKIDWNKPAQQIEREIRAFLGWPSSYAVLNGKDVKILDAEVAKYDSKSPGLVCNVAGELHVECGQDSLKINKLQVAGKKPISGAEFIRGYLRLSA